MQIKNLCKTYTENGPSASLVLNNISLHVERGEFVIVLGSNAAGKSTLLNLISGETQPTSGEILECNSTEVCKVKQKPDENIFCNLSLSENYALAKLKNKTPGLLSGVSEELEIELKEYLRNFNLSFEYKINNLASSFSGGQKQFFSMILATVTNPKVLLLDEHTASLDHQMKNLVLEFTNKIVREKQITTFMVTHNLHDAIKYGDRIIILRDGKIVFDVSGEEKRKLAVMDLLERLEMF